MKIICKKFALGYVLYFTRNVLHSFFGGAGEVISRALEVLKFDLLLSTTVFQMYSVFHPRIPKHMALTAQQNKSLIPPFGKLG